MNGPMKNIDKAQVLVLRDQVAYQDGQIVSKTLAQNNNVYLRGFGSFIVKKRAKKVARNISKNTTITIPAHNIPAFKPAKSFAAKVK